MARDFRARQVRTSIVIASGAMEGTKPHLGLVFASGSKMADYSGTFLTASSPSVPSVHSFNNAGDAQAGQLNLHYQSVGNDVWCVFDGASKGHGKEREEKLKGSTVLFLGDVVVSGSLFAENSVVEVDTTTAGHFYVPKDAHLSGGLYSGEQSTGVYALRVNPDNSAKDNIAANTVQVDDSTTFVAEGESRFGHISGYSGDGVTISNAGVISAKGDIKTDASILTARIAYTDNDYSIFINDGGTIRLVQGIENTLAVKVNAADSGNTANQWLKIAEIAETSANEQESASAFFTIRFTNRERTGVGASNDSKSNITVLLEVSFGSGIGSNYDPVINAEVFDANDSDDLNSFDPTTMIELWSKRHATDPTAAIYVRTPTKYSDVYVSILNGNRDTGSQSNMEWKVSAGQSWVTNAAHGSAKSTFDGGSNQDIFYPRLTEKKYSKVTTNQLTGSAGVAVEMNSQKFTLFHDGIRNVLSSSTDIAIIANGGTGDIKLDGGVVIETLLTEDFISHNESGANDTYIRFPEEDEFQLVAGGKCFVSGSTISSQKTLNINPHVEDIDFIVGGKDAGVELIKAVSGDAQVYVGADASNNKSALFSSSGVTFNPNNQSGHSFHFKEQGGGDLLAVSANTHSVIITGDADDDTIFKVKAASTTLLDVQNHTTNGITLGTANIPVKVVGNLEVAGTFTKINTTDLYVKDPVIVLGEGTQTLNSNGGIVICSGSNQAAKPDLVWGRVANDTWGAGVKNTISGSVTTLADMTLANIRASKIELGAAEEYISGDGTDINFTVGADGDINIPADIGLTFGDDGEKIEGDGTDLTIASSAKINLSATSDVHIPVNVGLVFGDDEKIEGNNTDLTISSGGKIKTVSAGDTIIQTTGNALVIKDGPNAVSGGKIEFGVVDGGESIERYNNGLRMNTDDGDLWLNAGAGNGDVIIEGNGNVAVRFSSADHKQWIASTNGSLGIADLVISTGANLVLSASNQVVLKSGVELEFGGAGSGEHIVGDGTDLSIVSGAKIKLSPTTSVEMQNDKPLNFDASGNFKIQKGSSSLDITGATINLNATSQVNVPEGVDLVFDAVGTDPDSAVKIKGDSSNSLNLSATSGEVKSDTHVNIASSKNLRFTDDDARVYRDGSNIMFRDGVQTTAVSLTTLNTRDVVDHAFRIALGPDKLKASGSFSIDKQDRYANNMGSDVWFYVDSNDAVRNKSVFAKDLILSSSLRFIDRNDAAGSAGINVISDHMIFSLTASNGSSHEIARFDPTIGLKLGETASGANAGLYFNSSTQKLSRVNNSFKFSTGASALTDLIIGEDNDDHDRTITFGHSTLKTIMGIDDSQNVFAINTDGSFESNNDLEIDTNGNIKVSGSMEIHDDMQITSISPGSAKIDLRRHEEDGIAVNGEDVGEVRFFVSEDGNNYGQLGGILMECAENFAHNTNHGSIMRFRTTAIGGTATANAASLDGEGNFTISGGLTCNSISMSDDSASALDIKEGNNSYLKFITSNSSEKIEISKSLIPSSNNTLDLGSGTNRFANIYTNDLNLCNEGRGNDVDGTSGNWTIQEGEDSLFVINNITGKKFKMMLQPIEDGE